MKLATLCYVRDNNKTLMVHRVFKAGDVHVGKWNGLGGKFEPGETPEECARREIKEESGLEVLELKLKGFLTFPKFARDEDWYVFVFIGRHPVGDLIESPEGKLAWIPDAEINKLNLWEGDKTFLPWLDEDRFFSGKFVYQGGQLVHQEVIHYF